MMSKNGRKQQIPPVVGKQIVQEAQMTPPRSEGAGREMPMDPVAAQTGSTATGEQENRSVIGVEQIRKAQQTLLEYKNGKKNLEERIIANEQWYKLRHWDYIRTTDKQQIEPVSGWLFNTIANKHADAMDNYPMANILPREESDKEEAEKLTAIVPVVMEHSDFEQVYNDAWDSKLRGGTGITGVFWNQSKLNGLGDIDIQEIDVLNLFWEPGISDVQKSRNFFSVELRDNDQLEEQYPQLKGKLGETAKTVSKYHQDDAVKVDGKSLVVDWYYKRHIGQKTVLHYCKYVNETVLFASENETKYAEHGWYDHGLYPFVFDPLFRVKGSPCGFGYIDLAKSAQEYIDKSEQAMLRNLQANARPRYFVRQDGGLNEEEFSDLNKDIVHVDGKLGQDSFMPIEGGGLSDVYVAMKQNKIDELKEITGNRDISTGGTSSGVTAASAIAAMQEAGSKLSRDANKASYRAYRKIVTLVVELIRQFYTQARCFRITGENGEEEFTRYDSRNIQLQSTGAAFGMQQTFRLPLFDVEISAQKQSPYSKLSQNELAIQFYNAGFFNPQLVDQAMACLEMMDFDRKQMVINRIQNNGMLYQQLQQAQQQIIQLSQIVDRLTGSQLTSAFGTQKPGAAPAAQMAKTDQALGVTAEESSVTKNARQRVADSTAPT